MVITLVVLALLAGALCGWIAGSRPVVRERQRSAGLDAALQAERGRRDALATAEAGLREAFESLSSQALERSSTTLLRLAEQRLGQSTAAADGTLAAREQAITAMVAPLQRSLDQVREQLHAVEQGRAASQAALGEQLSAMRRSAEELRTEAGHLVTALRAPQVRGRWGEMQLERVVEAAGLCEHVDYLTQATAADLAEGGGDSRVRPDLVVRLLGGKSIVVDAKAPFVGYLDAMQAQDEAGQTAGLKAHARHLREHIDGLAAKAYWESFAPTPEFVVCFVPADAVLDAALRADSGLLEHAFARNVVLATPSTLVALLRTVAYTWRQDTLAAHAAEVHRLGRELYQRLCTVGGHLDRLGKHLTESVGAYNRTVSSLETRVFVSARKMADLGVADGSGDFPSPRQVTETARLPQAPELTEPRVVPLAPHGRSAAEG